jgi:hypothetical protein
MSSASRRSRNWRLMAGRLSPSSAARLDGRRGRTATAAMIRRLVGSASNSIPGPFRAGISIAKHASSRCTGDYQPLDPHLRRHHSAWLELPRKGCCGAPVPAGWAATARLAGSGGGGPDGSAWLEPPGERRCARTCWRGRRVRTGGDGGGGPARSATGGTVAWRCSIGDRPHDGPGDRPSGRMVPLGWNNRERDVVCEVCPPGG